MRRSFVDESVIDLVTNHDQITRDGDLGERLSGWLVEGCSRRIRWVAEEERLGARSGCIDGLSVKAPVIARACRYWNGGAAGEDDRGEVGNVRRLRQHDAIARTDDAANGEVDRLGGPDRHNDLALWVVAHS